MPTDTDPTIPTFLVNQDDSVEDLQQVRNIVLEYHNRMLEQHKDMTQNLADSGTLETGQAVGVSCWESVRAMIDCRKRPQQKMHSGCANINCTVQMITVADVFESIGFLFENFVPIFGKPDENSVLFYHNADLISTCPFYLVEQQHRALQGVFHM